MMSKPRKAHSLKLLMHNEVSCRIHASVAFDLPYAEWVEHCTEAGVHQDEVQLHSWLVERLICSNDLAALFRIQIGGEPPTKSGKLPLDSF